MSLLQNTGKLAGKTAYITGASRGIGRAIALKLAKDNVNVVIAAKTTEPHPKLPGTIYSVAKEVEEAGGKALACVVDIRDEKQVIDSVKQAVAKFGGIDILINNASAINLTKTTDTDMKRYDLMHQINGRGTFLVTKTCIPYLKKGKNPHILNLSPPLSLQPRWFQNNVAYTMAKFNMSLCALGWAEEFRADGVAANCLWPATAIFTAAMEMLGGSDIKNQCRSPEIMSDAAYAILSRDSRKATGYFYIDENVLKEEGITDLKPYQYVDNAELLPDFFVEGVDSVHSSQYAIVRSGGAGASQAAAPAAAPVSAKSEAPAQSGGEGGGEITQIFNKIKSLLDPETVKKTNAIFQFDVKGNDGGMYYLDLKSSAEGSTGKGESPAKSDVVISVSQADFVKLFSGKLSPTSAYMMGKLKIKGDITKAMVLDKLMGKLKSKL